MTQRPPPTTRPEPGHKRTTIYDLATLAGTSPSAVSAVLNGTWKKRRISTRLAERIQAIAQEQGYALNVQASLLRKERSHIIGMIVPKYDNRYFGAIAERFEAMARAHGLFPVITCTQRDPDLEWEAARALLSYQVECLIATGATNPDRISDLCASAGVRALNLDLPGSKATSVTSDNHAGAYRLTQHIIQRARADLGYEGPLLFIGGRANDHNTAERIRGFQDAHRDLGLSLPPNYIVPCDYEPARAEQALDALNMPMPPGLFVNSTISLEGVVRWLNKNMPDHSGRLRFGCFDYDAFAALLPDNVAMVEQDVDGMLQRLFEVINKPGDAHEHIQVPCLFKVT